MTTHTAHKHGTFSWTDLATTDAAGAKKFYGELFGWTFDDMPAGPGMTYSMCKLGKETACALYEKGAEMKDVPSHWAAYVTVDDIEATTRKAATLGKVVKEPFDVMDVGRMSVVQDPSGAVLCLWQAVKHIGATVTKEPGATCWVELYTTNVDAAGKFYVQTIGWETSNFDMGPMGTYTLFSRAGEGKDGQIGGMMAMPPDMKGVPSNWLVYFQSEDVDASVKKVEALGGKVVMPPMDIPNIGRFAIAQDPQGATFSIYKNAH
jgi:predicted enzyme related to lactoylglutathione lyase